MRDRRRRVARWNQHERSPGLGELLRRADLVLSECARFGNDAAAALDPRHASDLDEGRRAVLLELARDMVELEQYGRIAILAALLPDTGRHDA
jgi:hypothetical protein